MFCTKCGSEVKDGAKFCTHCGAVIGETPDAAKAAAPQTARPVQRPAVLPAEPAAKKGGGALLTVLIVILAVLIVVVAGAAFWFLGGKDKIKDKISDVIGIETDADDDEDDEDDGRRKREDADDEEAESDDSDEEAGQSLFEEEAPVPADDETEGEAPTADASEMPLPEEEMAHSEYILENSDTEYLTKSDLAGFTAEQCRLARNELYARHGRLFDDEALQAYFDGCSWYQGRIAGEDFEESMLSEIEVANRDLIVEYEKEMGYR